MSSVLARWMVALSVLGFVAPGWACFAPPDAKPVHEISTIDLPQQIVGIAVRYPSERFVLEVAADDLVPIFAKEYMAVVSPADLAKALRAKMALGESFDTEAIVAVLIADAAASPNAASMPESWVRIQADTKLRHAFANLLAAGKASVTKAENGQVLARLQLDRFREICHSGRLFMTTPAEQTILRIVDAIS